MEVFACYFDVKCLGWRGVYLGHDGRSVSVTGDEDDEGPVVRVHEDASRLSAGRVEGCGASAVGALDAAALHLPPHPLPAVCALLWRGANQGSKGF